MSDQNLTGASAELKSSVDSYNTGVANIHLRVDLKSYELVKGNIFNQSGFTSYVYRYERPKYPRRS